MLGIFVDSFGVTFFAVFKILLIIFTAGLLVRKKYISQVVLKSLATSVVRIFLPCLTFSSIVMNFEPSKLKIWPLLPISAIVLIVFGLGFGTLVFGGKLNSKRNLLALASFQNAGYFILPMGAVLFPEQVEKFNLYCFLFILGISPTMWSLGKVLISSDSKAKIKIAELFTPPLLANLVALVMVFTGLRNIVPAVAVESIYLVGKGAVPVAIFILGGMLGSVTLRFDGYKLDAAKVVAIKLLAVPFMATLIVHLTGLGNSYPLLASFIILQSSSAPATALLMQVKHYGGDEQKISSITLLCYLMCIITIPLWMAVWKILA